MTVELTINEMADYWFYEIGVNPIPVYSQNKGKTHEKGKHWCPIGSYDHWLNNELPESTFEQWKEQNLFENGIAIIGGKVYRGNFKGYYLCMIDLDNQLAIDELFPHGLEKAGHRTLVEQHKDRLDKAHVYFYTKESVHKKSSSGNNDDASTPAIEVKGSGGHGVHVVSPSIHADGERYDITSIARYPTIVNNIEEQVQKICSKYGIKYLDNTQQFDKTKYQEYSDPSYKIGESEGRRPALLVCCNHWFWERQDRLDDEKIKDEVYELAITWNKEHCTVALSDEQVRYQVECAYNYSIKSKENGSMYPLTISKDENKEEFYDILRDQILEKYDFLCTDDKNREFCHYKDGKYIPGAEGIIDTFIELTVKGSDKKTRSEVTEKVKIRSLISRDEIDADDNILNLKNTLFDIEKGTPLPHTPSYKSITQWNVTYNKDAKCPKFLKFLTDVILEPKERVTTLQMMAELFWKKSTLTKSYFLLGKGGNGKSILRDVIVEMVGEKNTSGLEIGDYSDTFLPAELFGKVVNFPDEVDDTKVIKTSKWKSATANRAIQAQRKHGHPFTFIPYAKNIMPCNRPPELDDKSDGVYRRIIPIHFDQRFTHNLTDEERKKGVKQADEDFTASLLDEQEISGLFNLLVKIVKNLKKEKRLRYTMTIESVRKEWETLANTIKEFVAENLIEDVEGIALKTDFHRKYIKFCKEKNYNPDGQNTFYAKFQKEGAISVRERIEKHGNPQNCFKGFWFKGVPKQATNDEKQSTIEVED